MILLEVCPDSPSVVGLPIRRIIQPFNVVIQTTLAEKCDKLRLPIELLASTDALRRADLHR